MREILFRGQDAATGDWIKGFYVHLFDDKGNKAHRIYSGYAETDCEDYYPDFWEVGPETVGQFTGLTDKNGKKIFEHDIVRCIRFMCDEKEMVGHIVYDECCFSVKESKSPNQPAMDLCDCFEVIGNIHDNPELLEVE